MCIALPMKVLESGPMMVVCERNGRRLEVDCSMIDQPAVGAWLLVFQNRALREIEEAEAGEIEAALGATARVMAGDVDEETIRSGFGDLIDRGPELPEHLRALVGRADVPGAPDRGQSDRQTPSGLSLRQHHPP